MSFFSRSRLAGFWQWAASPQAPWICAALALGVRVAIVLAMHDWRAPESWEYGMIADNLLAGEGFSGSAWFLPEGPTAFMAPGYVFLLAGARYALGGFAYAALQFAQCIAGAAAVLLIHRVARRLFGPRTATGAAIVLALNPLHAYLPVFIHPLAITELLTVAVVLLILRMRERPDWRRAMALGAVYGIALLTEPSLMCLLPLLLIAPWWAAKNFRGRAIAAVLAVVIALAVVAPWTVRNYIVFERFVFIKSAFGYILWAGNHEGAPGTQTYINDAGEVDHVAHHVPGHILEAIEGMSEPEAYDVFAREAVSFITAHPVQTMGLAAKKAMYYWWFPTWQTSAYDAEAPLLRQFRHPEKVVWLVVLVTAIPGLWFARRRWRDWAIIPAVLLCFTALYAITTVSNGPRYRVPIEPFVMAFSAVALRRVSDPTYHEET